MEKHLGGLFHLSLQMQHDSSEQMGQGWTTLGSGVNSGMERHRQLQVCLHQYLEPSDNPVVHQFFFPMALTAG
jgi:hypothetical protein